MVKANMCYDQPLDISVETLIQEVKKAGAIITNYHIVGKLTVDLDIEVENIDNFRLAYDNICTTNCLQNISWQMS